MKKWIILILIVGFLFYWFQIRPERKLDDCFEGVGEWYNKTWDRWDEDGDGRLARGKADRLSQMQKEAKERCIKRYK